MGPFVVVDIETSGLNPQIHEIIEVGYVNSEGYEVEFSLAFDLERASPKALEVNGWGRRQFAPQITSDGAVELLYRDFSNRSVVASPAHFDIGFLEEWFRSGGYISFPWSHRSIIDLKSYACGKWGVLEDLGNKTISERLGIEDTSNHSALQDARWIRDLFVGVMNS